MSNSDQTTKPDETLAEIGLEQFAPYLMNRIMGRYNASLRDGLSEFGLTTVQMRTLAVLAVNDGMMINELTVFAVSEQSTMSRTLDQMEKAGWIERRSDAKDNRSRRIYLTSSGRDRFDRLWPSLAAAEAQMFETISNADRDAFVSTLQQILKNVRHHNF